MKNVFIKQRFELYIEKRRNTSKSNPKHDMKQAKIVLDNIKKYHQLRKRFKKGLYLFCSDKILKIIPTRPNNYSQMG